MSVIDVDKLLRELSSESPCGDDLEYDAAFMEMGRLAAGRPAQEIGAQVSPGEEPDWRTVRERALELFQRTRDLRVATLLARALLRTDGIAGFADGIALNRGLIERWWGPVHPRLDPDDANDPTLRVNTLSALSDRDLTVTALRMHPLANSRRVGRFSLRDIELANGTLPRPENAEGIADLATIEAAFLDADAGELQATATAVAATLEQLAALDQALDNAVGGGSSADFSLLRTTLKAISHQLGQQLARRGLASGDAGASPADGGEAAATGGAPAMSGTIQSREDIIRMLDQACDWYARNEPSSPVPLLLQRAKRLVSKNFVELVQDLSPGGLTELQTIAGLDSSQ